MDEETAQFIRDNLDSRAKLDVALFLHQNRFAVESAEGLTKRIGRTPEDLAPELRELAAARVISVHGEPDGPRPCLYGSTQDGMVAKMLGRVARLCEGTAQSSVLAQVLEGQARRHNLRVRELRRLDSLKTQFLSMMSHELRTPLTAIKGYIDLLQSNPDLDAEQRQLFLDTVAAQCDRLSTTVNNILMAAEMQHGEGWKGNCRALELHHVVGVLVDELAVAEPRRIVDLRVPHGLPLVSADETGVKLVVRNLLDNAVKFSLDGSTIRVWLEDCGGEVHLHIGDDGVGISPDRLRTIFERFFQAEYYRTRRVGGAGLGLYLVREIMEGMGGRIEVKSELGKGSMFTCVFLSAAASPADAAEGDFIPGQSAASGGGLR